jgi:hypothetical protein
MPFPLSPSALQPFSLHSRALGYRYKKAEVTLPNGAKAYQIEFGPRKQDVQNDWAEAAQADKENDGRSVSSVTDIKSFDLENTDEMSFTNSMVVRSRKLWLLRLRRNFGAGWWVLWMDDLLVRTVMIICMH